MAAITSQAITTSTTSTTSTHSTFRPSRSIENLRSLAQAHLREIEQERSDEHYDRLARNLQLEKYSHQARKSASPPSQHPHRGQALKSTSQPRQTPQDRPATPPPSLPPETKQPKLRPASDVLHRIAHDPSLQLSDRCEYIIGYLERFDGIVEMPVANWIRESTDEDFIPQHRIRYITRRMPGDDEVVWSRDGRVDLIFGSGSAS